MVYINIKFIIILISVIGGSLVFIIYVSSLIGAYSTGVSREDRKRLNRRKKEAKKRSGPRF